MPHAHWHSERQLLKNRDSAPAPDDRMPRSFLIKKHQSTKKTNCGRLKSKTEEASSSTPEDCLLHSDIPPHHHHPTSSPWLQQRPQSLSSSSCPLSFKADILSLASSSPCSFLCPATDLYSRSPAEVHRPTESYTQMDLKFQYVVGHHMRRKSLLPQSLPFLALFPATPPGDSSRESFECLEYHKEYLSFSGMAMHKQRQCAWSSKKFFSCKYCEKEYISLGALKMHIRTHTLPCVCKLCGKAFSRPWLLQGHIRTHTGEKPFSCLHCSRAFADRSNLRAHLQTHSEVKKYQCASCFKTFSRISLLCKHQETLCPLV